MALAIDGYAVLGRIAASPNAFSNIRTDVAKAAQTLVFAQLKAKAASIETLRAVRMTLNAEPFALIVEALKDAQVKSLVTKYDKHNTAMRTATAQARRRHLCVLADASVTPAQKLTRARKPGAKAKKASTTKLPEPERLSSEAMGARRERR